MSKAPGVKWTREHFLIALNLYCKLPFGQLCSVALGAFGGFAQTYFPAPNG